jgi:CRISPR-associated endoribonuclease Cas6
LLYSTVLTLRARGEGPPKTNLGYQAYAAVLALIGESDPALASALHDTEGAKPLTVSPPWSARRLDSGGQDGNGRLHRIRITALSDEVFSALAQSVLLNDRSKPLRVADASFDVLGLATTPKESRLAACSAFKELLRKAEPRSAVSLRFVTPTTFRSGGRRNVIFPDTGLLFRSYVARWNALSPERLPESLGEVASERLFIARYALRTAMLDFGGYSEAGFVGVCEVRAQEGTPAETLCAFQALADFAVFAGTGAKTAMGMGQTRTGSDVRSLSH